MLNRSKTVKTLLTTFKLKASRNSKNILTLIRKGQNGENSSNDQECQNSKIYYKRLLHSKGKNWAVVVAQLVERSPDLRKAF